MAFVYRSEKESLFDRKMDDPFSDKHQIFGNEPSQLNGITNNDKNCQRQKSSGKISKGLPSLLKKDKISELDQQCFEKQNSNSEQKKIETPKFNMQKLKRITENYFFSSKVPREINLTPSLKSLSKNLTCTQFITNLDKLNESVPDTKISTPPNYIDPNNIVNKSLTDPQMDNNCRKTFNQSITNNVNVQKIVPNLSQANESVRRKSALPQSLEKITFQNVLKKANDLKQLNKQKSVDNMNESFMSSLLEKNQSLMKRHFTEKKLKKLHKGNLKTSFYKDPDSQSQQSQEEEAISYSKQIPGPGAYNNNSIELKEKRSFRSRKQKFAKIFVSPLQRFVNDGVKYHEITYVNQSEGMPQKRVYSNQVFVSKTPNGLQPEKRSGSPPLGTYDPRQSIEHDVVRNLLKSSNVPNFNSSMPRFNYPKPDLTLGPGSYNYQTIQQTKKQEVKNQLTSSYKSQVKRYGDNGSFRRDQSNRSKLDFTGGSQFGSVVIHKRQQHFDSSEFFSPPPFSSSVQRFPEHNAKNDISANYHLIGEKKTQQKQKITSAPFNTSAKRIITQPLGFGVGAGSYLIQKDLWNKKSYNINFH